MIQYVIITRPQNFVNGFCKRNQKKFSHSGEIYAHRQILKGIAHLKAPQQVKPSYRLKPGDEVELSYAAGAMRFRVLELKETVKKDEASSLYEVLP